MKVIILLSALVAVGLCGVYKLETTARGIKLLQGKDMYREIMCANFPKVSLPDVSKMDKNAALKVFDELVKKHATGAKDCAEVTVPDIYY